MIVYVWICELLPSCISWESLALNRSAFFYPLQCPWRLLKTYLWRCWTLRCWGSAGHRCPSPPWGAILEDTLWVPNPSGSEVLWCWTKADGHSATNKLFVAFNILHCVFSYCLFSLSASIFTLGFFSINKYISSSTPSFSFFRLLLPGALVANSKSVDL